MRKWLVGSAALLLCWLVVELTSWGGLYLLKLRGLRYDPILVDRLRKDQRNSIERLVNDQAAYTMFDSTLGWTIKPNGRFRDVYWANSGGFRANREYDLVTPPGHVRL